jgi:hypothetical protein
VHHVGWMVCGQKIVFSLYSYRLAMYSTSTCIYLPNIHHVPYLPPYLHGNHLPSLPTYYDIYPLAYIVSYLGNTKCNWKFFLIGLVTLGNLVFVNSQLNNGWCVGGSLSHILTLGCRP